MTEKRIIDYRTPVDGPRPLRMDWWKFSRAFIVIGVVALLILAALLSFVSRFYQVG